MSTEAREQSLGEEIANSVSHGVGLVASFVGAPALVVRANQQGGAATMVGASVFGATLVLLYLASTLYHALPRNRAKRVFQALDHAAILFLIAGSYTPFALGVLRGGWGWTLLGLVWGMALAGVALQTIGLLRYPALATSLYLIMGWLGLTAVRPLWLRIPHAGFGWVLAGGIAYTAGVAFFAAERIRYSHFIWHLCVLAGTACHFFAVFRYAA